MAQERIEIVVTEKGTRAVRRNIDNIGDSAERSQGAVKLLNRALAAVAAAGGVAALTRLAETYTNIQNRLRNVTNSTEELSAVTKELFDISNRTRASFETIGDVYSRVALAVREMGISQKQTLQFTESLSQAVTLSGASSQEAAAGITQLSQGLASGTLRGDELRSVLEQLPAVADVIAKGLGVTRGELRRLGEEGRISARDILTAFQAAREELDEKFSKTVPTIGQAFTVLTNKITQFIGELDEALGGTSVFAQAILFLADHIEEVAKALGVAGLVAALVLAKNGVVALTAAIMANPLGALAVAALAAGSALAAFSSEIKVTSDGVVTLEDLAVATFDEIGKSISGMSDDIGEFGDDVEALIREVFPEFNLSFEDVLRAWARMQDAWILSATTTVDTVVDLFAHMWDVIAGDAQTSMEIVTQIFTDNLSELERRWKEGGPLGSFVDRVFDNARGRAQGRTEIEIRNPNNFGDTPQDTSGAAASRAFNSEIKDLREENELLRLNTEERAVLARIMKAEDQLKRKLSETERALVRSLVIENRELERMSDTLEEIKGPAREFAQTKEALNKLYGEGKIDAGEYAEALREAELAALEHSRTLEGGLRRGLLNIAEEIGDVSRVVEDGLVNAFRSAEDAVVDFVRTGKFSFRDLATSIIEDLARIAVRQAVTAPIVNALGSAFSAAMSSAFSGATTFSTGGMVLAGGGGTTDSALARVSNGEYIVNAAATRRNKGLLDLVNAGKAPVTTPTFSRAAPSGDVRIVLNNNTGTEAEAEAQQGVGRDGTRELVITLSRKLGEDVARGGPLGRSIQSTFGLNRQGRQ